MPNERLATDEGEKVVIFTLVSVERFNERVRLLRSMGLSMNQIAKRLKMNRRTLDNWAKRGKGEKGLVERAMAEIEGVIREMREKLDAGVGNEQ